MNEHTNQIVQWGTGKAINLPFSRLSVNVVVFPSHGRKYSLWGAVIKYGTEGGGRDLTGSAKLLDGKCWAGKIIFQVISMGHEGICLQYLQLF